MPSQRVNIDESPLFWPARLQNGVLEVLDETLIPSRVKFIRVRTTRESVKVIREMKTRAFGQLLVVLNTFLLLFKNKKGMSERILLREIQKMAEKLNASRPTFPFSEVTGRVVAWAQTAFDNGDDISNVVSQRIRGYLEQIRIRRLGRVRRLAGVIKNGDSVLTHCNVSGELAMAAALCRKNKKRVQFFATETRPYFQGAKLTCWELKKVGADVTLITDNAVASVMSDGLVNKVIVGSDRNCANGDFANKIGTYAIAVLAKEFEIPFYVLTQPSRRLKNGRDIPIEFRDPDEILIFRGKRVVPRKVKALYPGFDIIPHQYVTKAIELNVN